MSAAEQVLEKVTELRSIGITETAATEETKEDVKEKEEPEINPGVIVWEKAE